MSKRIFNFKFTIHNCQKGMTYTELIVMLAIFGIMSSVILVNYGDFNSKMEVKSLSNNIALKIVEAQKSAMSGKITGASFDVEKVPAYGLNFDTSGNTENKKKFIYFADKNNDGNYDNGELLDTININSKFQIKSLKVFCATLKEANELDIVFKRPDSTASVDVNPSCGSDPVYYATINLGLLNSQVANSSVTIYPSGRIQIN